MSQVSVICDRSHNDEGDAWLYVIDMPDEITAPLDDFSKSSTGSEDARPSRVLSRSAMSLTSATR